MLYLHEGYHAASSAVREEHEKPFACARLLEEVNESIHSELLRLESQSESEECSRSLTLALRGQGGSMLTPKVYMYIPRGATIAIEDSASTAQPTASGLRRKNILR